jgi:hypothetical protein
VGERLQLLWVCVQQQRAVSWLCKGGANVAAQNRNWVVHCFWVQTTG